MLTSVGMFWILVNDIVHTEMFMCRLQVPASWLRKWILRVTLLLSTHSGIGSLCLDWVLILNYPMFWFAHGWYFILFYFIFGCWYTNRPFYCYHMSIFKILARTLELNSSTRLNDLVDSFVNETNKNLGTLLLLGWC